MTLHAVYRLFLASTLLALATSAMAADTLTLNIFHSPRGINWRSPASLARSAIFGEVGSQAHSIGHVDVRVDCQPDGAQRGVSIATGMTGASDDETRQLLLQDQVGLGILFHTFQGRLRSADEVLGEEAQFLGTSRFAQLIFDVSPTTCLRAARYIEEFRALGYDNLYGTPNRPRYREGAGCSAFAASVLEVAGLLPFSGPHQWNLDVNVPARFVGGPLTGYNVPIRRVLLSPFATRWAEESEPHFPLSVWDPDLFHEWVWAMASGYAPASGLPWSWYQVGSSLVLEIDGQSVPTPVDSFWLNR